MLLALCALQPGFFASPVRNGVSNGASVFVRHIHPGASSAMTSKSGPTNGFKNGDVLKISHLVVLHLTI